MPGRSHRGSAGPRRAARHGKEEGRTVFSRHEAALEHCRGAPSRSVAAHSGRADQRPRSQRHHRNAAAAVEIEHRARRHDPHLESPAGRDREAGDACRHHQSRPHGVSGDDGRSEAKAAADPVDPRRHQRRRSGAEDRGGTRAGCPHRRRHDRGAADVRRAHRAHQSAPGRSVVWTCTRFAPSGTTWKPSSWAWWESRRHDRRVRARVPGGVAQEEAESRLMAGRGGRRLHSDIGDPGHD